MAAEPPAQYAGDVEHEATELAPMSYDEWVEYCFTRGHDEWSAVPQPVECQRALSMPNATIAEYLVSLMENSGGLAARFERGQTADGVRFLFGIGSGYFEQARGPDVPAELRLRVYRAIPRIYADHFDTVCTPPSAGWLGGTRDALDGAVFRIWDMDVVEGVFFRNDLVELREPAFGALETILTACTHPICLKSALHGLGHAALGHPARAAAIIDAFLDRRGDEIPAWLDRYAAHAREGNVQ